MRQTGLSRYRLEGTVHGYRQPRMDEMVLIARALHLPVDVIFFVSDISISDNDNYNVSQGTKMPLGSRKGRE